MFKVSTNNALHRWLSHDVLTPQRTRQSCSSCSIMMSFGWVSTHIARVRRISYPRDDIRDVHLYYYGKAARNAKENKFWILMRLWAAKYLHSIEKIWKAPNTLSKACDKWIGPQAIGSLTAKRLHWNIQNEIERRKYFKHNSIDMKDWIIIATDGSVKKGPGWRHAGLGVQIRFQGKVYELYQGLGDQPINLPYKTTPVCIRTDNETCFF